MIRASDLLRYEAQLREAKDVHAFIRLVVDLTPPVLDADRLMFFRRRWGEVALRGREPRLLRRAGTPPPSERWRPWTTRPTD